ncbi:30S ribosomal protein S17 [Candidatus Woesearchaeota archaeon]|nr:30S ribosomal protein S17 [Candidatus Woesearchaeota archaeon]
MVKETQECNDKKCPVHGNVSLRGRTFTGIVIGANMAKTATVEWTYKLFIPKYERSETRKSKVHAHNPICINAQVGDVVKIMETRPLSKTKNFVIIKKLRRERGFKEKLEEKEEEKAKVIESKTREKIEEKKEGTEEIKKEVKETKEKPQEEKQD